MAATTSLLVDRAMRADDVAEVRAMAIAGMSRAGIDDYFRELKNIALAREKYLGRLGRKAELPSETIEGRLSDLKYKFYEISCQEQPGIGLLMQQIASAAAFAELLSDIKESDRRKEIGIQGQKIEEIVQFIKGKQPYD